MAQLPTTTTQARPVATIALVTTALLFAMLVRFSFLNRPFDSDGAIVIYMGKLVDEGGEFGVDLIDNKPPTVGLMTSIAWRAFGVNWSGYVVLGMLMSVIAALAIGRAVNLARPGRFVRAFGIALVLLNIQPFIYGGFQTETLQMSFAALACAMGVAALVRADWRDALAAGLCGGCAAMLKPSGLAILAALACCFMMTLRVRSFWLLMSMTLGALVVAGGAGVYLLCSGSLDYLIRQMREAAAYASNSSTDAFALFKLTTVLGIMLALIGVTTLLGRRGPRQPSNPCLASVVVLAILWLAIETVGVAMQRRMYAYHFLPMFAPAALLVALLPRNLSLRIVLAIWIIPFALSFDQTRSLYLQQPDERLALSDYFAQHADRNDRVWMDDYPRLLIETNLKAGSRLPLTFLFINDDTAPLRYTRILLDDLRQNNTRYVVLPHDTERIVQHHIAHNRELAAFENRRDNYANAWKHIDQAIRRDYSFETSIDGLDIFIRRPPDQVEMDRADLADTPI